MELVIMDLLKKFSPKNYKSLSMEERIIAIKQLANHFFKKLNICQLYIVNICVEQSILLSYYIRICTIQCIFIRFCFRKLKLCFNFFYFFKYRICFSTGCKRKHSYRHKKTCQYFFQQYTPSVSVFYRKIIHLKIIAFISYFVNLYFYSISGVCIYPIVFSIHLLGESTASPNSIS